VKTILKELRWMDGEQVTVIVALALITAVGFGLILFGGRA
jgi:hypothetical protein